MAKHEAGDAQVKAEGLEVASVAEALSAMQRAGGYRDAACDYERRSGRAAPGDRDSGVPDAADRRQDAGARREDRDAGGAMKLSSAVLTGSEGFAANRAKHLELLRL